MTHVTIMKSDCEQRRTMMFEHGADDTKSSAHGVRSKASYSTEAGEVLLCVLGTPVLLMFLAACVWAIAVG